MRLIFERTEFERFKKLKRCWRKPRGLHNKLRLGKKCIKPKIGYKKLRKEEVPRINNSDELKKLNTKKIIIASKIGKKKRLEIMKYCEENKIKILN